MFIYQLIVSNRMKIGVEYQSLWKGQRMAPHSHVPEGMDGWAAQATLHMEFMKTMDLEKQMKGLFTDRFGYLSQTRRAEIFSRLLEGYEDSMMELGTLSKYELTVIRKTHDSL